MICALNMTGRYASGWPMIERFNGIVSARTSSYVPKTHAACMTGPRPYLKDNATAAARAAG